MSLESTYPEYYSKYSLVTFREEIPYSEAMKIGRWQDDVLLDYCRKTKDTSLETALELTSGYPG